MRTNLKPKQFAHYSHSPFSVRDQKVMIEVDKTGKTRLIEEHNDEEYTEITCSAGLIINLSRVLKSIEGKNIRIKIEDGNIVMTQEHDDKTFDDIKLSAELISKASRVIFTTREVTMKDTPYDGEPPE